MLLVHQEGSVKVGEVVRYTLTYTPTEDRILPTPSQLHVRIKNTSAIPYRAAYLVGPYTIHASAYSANYTPYKKLEDPKNNGIPQFEPNLKAGGHFHAKLQIPDAIQQSGDREWFHGSDGSEAKSVTWIIEIASQILFSQSAAVHYELLVARDERSLDTGFAALASRGHGEPGKINDVVQFKIDGPGNNPAPKGVYSRAVKLIAQDTAQLWNTPALPQWPEQEQQDRNAANKRRSWKAGIRRSMSETRSGQQNEEQPPRKRKKIHLVILTHGLHSNVGADMLYMKESIDATIKQAREDARTRKAEMRKRERQSSSSRPKESADGNDLEKEGSKQETSTAPLSGGQEDLHEDEETREDEDDEQVIVRGFSGNVTRTEKGIQYLGKRLAKFILTMTYPDQPFLPVAKSMSRTLSNTFSSNSSRSSTEKAAHAGSSIHRSLDEHEKLPYTFTSISFIGHSLGGLIQLYAIGYIRKHSPQFFDQIKPVNFVTMAAPLLGLSNENPLYVRFALDFGLVGRTGQDLGLTWRAPTIARSGWTAMISGLGSNQDKQQEKQHEDPRAKPLLRILPSGPAHHVLKQFRNRTVYANVVNDGIVPLRTSCLLFLDWRGLDRVDNARRDNGLLSTMAQFGWNELTGQNTVSHAPDTGSTDKLNATEGNVYDSDTLQDEKKARTESPEPSAESPAPHQFLTNPLPNDQSSSADISALSPTPGTSSPARATSPGPFGNFLKFFRSASPKRATSPTEHLGTPNHPSTKKPSRKTTEKLRRAQTMAQNAANAATSTEKDKPPPRPVATRGDSLLHSTDPNTGPPPKTSIFEAASDIVNPPIPTQSWITDPATRNRTIFHDRIYHPEDIPPPPQKKASRSVSSLVRSVSSDSIKPRSFTTETLPSTPSTPSPPLSRRKSHQPTTASSPHHQNTQHHNSDNRTRTTLELGPQTDTSSMSVEEKIARAYHRDLSWRKVLVRLEPDAHNNMIVRRMFANAYGWDVVRHLCETHFADTYTSNTRDEDETGGERAGWSGRVEERRRGEGGGDGAGSEGAKGGAEVGTGMGRDVGGEPRDGSNEADPPYAHQLTQPIRLTAQPETRHTRTRSELREEADTVPEMVSRGPSARSAMSRRKSSERSEGRATGEGNGTGQSDGKGEGRRESVNLNDDEFFERDESGDEWDGEVEMGR